MHVFAIETSCDETAAAWVDSAQPLGKRILAQCVRSQISLHQANQGVVPEIAARAHLEWLPLAVQKVMDESGEDLSKVDAIAATTGPGLIGGLTVGTSFAKSLSLASGKPFVAVNHLAGHALSLRLSHDLRFPYLLLLVSGGHCQVLAVEGVGRYRRWGTTIDDAVGEAFDKVGRLLDLPYPGGPHLEALAEDGDPQAFALPRPLRGQPGCDFSFSGLKTAVRRQIEQLDAPLTRSQRADLAASFQAAAAESLADRARQAMTRFRAEYGGPGVLAVAGGVAANHSIRAALAQEAAAADFAYAAAPLALCGDNAAMIAWAALEQLEAGGSASPLDTLCRPRWPLDPEAAASRFAGAAKA